MRVKDVGDGLGVKNTSEYMVFMGKKQTKEEIKCFKMTEKESLIT